MKCGTRALIDYLALHPDVVTAPHETNYFSIYYGRGVQWYRSEMPLSRPNQITMEKSPSYFRHREAPVRIHAMNAKIKIMLTVRDPVARSVSDWLHHCRRYESDISTCRTYESSGILTPTGQINRNSPFIIRSSFARAIENWTQLFPIGTRFHIVDGHKLVSDPVSELEKVETFLGLRHHITQKNLVFNEKRGFYCMVSDRKEERCLGDDKGVKHPTLLPEVDAKLRSYFQPLNQHFYHIVGRDFGWP
ncbi:Heparan sulfate glucosamine 3-O-sulfotransferase 5 [Lamellibrachia satsuma]|nr:Heparan sulfate glucosamine 3-O-sulfotransferase 5 [Lamellibrachia satsuma]